MGAPDREIADGDRFEVAGTTLVALHTPGHSPGSTTFYARDLGVVFTGDTPFNGGPGATGRSYSDYPTIVASIRDRLLTLPEKTVVKTGHGDDTSVAAEKPSLPEWEAKVLSPAPRPSGSADRTGGPPGRRAVLSRRADPDARRTR